MITPRGYHQHELTRFVPGQINLIARQIPLPSRGSRLGTRLGTRYSVRRLQIYRDLLHNLEGSFIKQPWKWPLSAGENLFNTPNRP